MVSPRRHTQEEEWCLWRLESALRISSIDACTYLLWWRYLHASPEWIRDNLGYDLSLFGTTGDVPGALARLSKVGLVSQEHDAAARLSDERKRLLRVLSQARIEKRDAERVVHVLCQHWFERDKYAVVILPGSEPDRVAALAAIQNADSILWASFSMVTRRDAFEALLDRARAGADVRLMVVDPRLGQDLEGPSGARNAAEQTALILEVLGREEKSSSGYFGGVFEVRAIHELRDGGLRGGFLTAGDGQTTARINAFTPRIERGISGRLVVSRSNFPSDGPTTVGALVQERLETAWARALPLQSIGLPKVNSETELSGDDHSLLRRVAKQRHWLAAHATGKGGGFSGAGVFELAEAGGSGRCIVKITAAERDAVREMRNFSDHVQMRIDGRHCATSAWTGRIGNRWATLQTVVYGDPLERAIVLSTDGGLAVSGVVKSALHELTNKWYQFASERPTAWRAHELWRKGGSTVASARRRMSRIVDLGSEFEPVAQQLEKLELDGRCSSRAHGDLNPNNLFVQGATGEWALIDFYHTGSFHPLFDLSYLAAQLRVEVLGMFDRSVHLTDRIERWLGWESDASAIGDPVLPSLSVIKECAREICAKTRIPDRDWRRLQALHLFEMTAFDSPTAAKRIYALRLTAELLAGTVQA